MRTIWFLSLVLLAAATAQAQLKVEKVPAADGQPETYKMSVHDATLTDAITAFEKQTGIDVALDNPDDPNAPGGPPVVYDVEFDGLSRREAIKELARTLSLGTLGQNGRGPVRLSRNSWSDDDNTESRDTSGVALSYVSRQQYFPPSQQQQDSLNLQFRVYGGRKPLSGNIKIEVTEAVDDQGRSLAAPNRRGETFFENAVGQPSVEISTSVNLPSPAPAKLAKLKGVATIMRAKTMLRVSTDKLTDAAMEAEFDGGTVAIGPLAPSKEDAKKWSLPVELTRGSMPNEKWNALQRQFFNSVSGFELRSADGERLYLQSRGGSSSGNVVKMQTVVTRNPEFVEQPNAKPMPRPASFKWDTVAETVAEEVPFELTDVALP